jgi:hypothetical protein
MNHYRRFQTTVKSQPFRMTSEEFQERRGYCLPIDRGAPGSLCRLRGYLEVPGLQHYQIFQELVFDPVAQGIVKNQDRGAEEDG